MANIFQPGDASETSTSTPGAATNALSQFKLRLLQAYFNAFNSPYEKRLHPGLPDIAFPTGGGPGQFDNVLNVLGQPNAFASTKTATGKPASPSGVQDIASIGVVLALLNQLATTGKGDSQTTGVDKLMQLIYGGGASGNVGTNQIPSVGAGALNYPYGSVGDYATGGSDGTYGVNAGDVASTDTGNFDWSMFGY